MSSRLREILHKRNPELAKTVDFCVGQATPQLWHTYAAFPSGTKHTPEHTNTVEKIASWLLSDELVDSLSDDELAHLILGFHYHDLGMVGSEADNLTEEGRNRVRREHALSIGETIIKQWRELGFSSESDAEILSLICKGHRPQKENGTANWDNLPELRIAGPGRQVRVRLVSAIVYAADELHIGDDRAPRREEEFNQIVSTVSRQHWRRHQAVRGPVLRNGFLCFDISVSTMQFEEELRLSLKKAFQSVAELAAQLAASGCHLALPKLSLQWNRAKVWELLCVDLCSDLSPRSQSVITQEIERVFQDKSSGFTALDSLCHEVSSILPLAAEIEQAANKFITQEYLRPADIAGEFALDGSSRTTDFVFQLARNAEVLDNLFVTRESPQHLYRLHSSPFGRRFVREHLTPRLHGDYHIDLVDVPHNQHLRTALERSPTASSIAQLINVPPGVLVQTDLLTFATIAGTCADLIHDPELILQPDYRSALSNLFKTAQDRLPKFLLFIEELAIIKKLTLDQVFEASVHSDEALQESPSSSHRSFTLTQQFPISRPEWSLGYLMLASLRAEVSIAIQNTDSAPFRVEGIVASEIEGDKPVLLSIGPGTPSRPATISFRGLFQRTADGAKVALCLTKLSANDQGKPINVRFTPKEGGTAEFTLRAINCELVLSDIQLMRSISPSDQIEVLLEGKLFSSIGATEVLNVGDSLSSPFILRCAETDATLPLPLYVLTKDVKQLEECEEDKRSSQLESMLAYHRSKRQIIVTVFLRVAGSDGTEYYEEYLGDLPPHFRLNAPTVKGDGISQDQVNESWNIGKEEMSFEAGYREDIPSLSSTIRSWVDDISLPFPVSMKHDLKFHYAKTRVSVTLSALMDRQWYVERRITFRLRPLLRAERYGIEMEYWKAQGDSARAELLNELFQAAAAKDVQQLKGSFSSSVRQPTSTSNNLQGDGIT